MWNDNKKETVYSNHTITALCQFLSELKQIVICDTKTDDSLTGKLLILFFALFWSSMPKRPAAMNMKSLSSLTPLQTHYVISAITLVDVFVIMSNNLIDRDHN